MKEKKKFRIKKLFKSRIFFFILGIFLTSIISVSAATLLYSKDVTYDNSSSGMSATTVQAALDELYEQAGKCPEGYGCIPTIPSSKIIENVVTSGDGLYADSVESGRYIYKGKNSSVNNYITFNEETWRIISIESDGTMKIIKQDSIGTKTWDTMYSRSAAYCSSYEKGCDSWGSSTTTYNASGTLVTSMTRQYGGTAYALPTEEASLNIYLNTTYYNSLNNTAQSQIVPHFFNISSASDLNTDTISTNVTQESAYKWKGKVALANATDYVRASVNSACTNIYNYTYFSESSCYYSRTSDNWMYNSNIANWWTLTPDSGPDSYILWFVSAGELKYNRVADYYYDVRPVVFLSKDVTFTGSGTAADPYVAW